MKVVLTLILKCIFQNVKLFFYDLDDEIYGQITSHHISSRLFMFHLPLPTLCGMYREQG